jgi:hypothetical protein
MAPEVPTPMYKETEKTGFKFDDETLNEKERASKKPEIPLISYKKRLSHIREEEIEEEKIKEHSSATDSDGGMLFDVIESPKVLKN